MPKKKLIQGKQIDYFNYPIYANLDSNIQATHLINIKKASFL